MSVSFPRIWFIPSFGGLSNIVEEIHGLIWIFVEEVTPTHGFQELFHGRGHSIIKMVNQHPRIEAMVWVRIDGFKIPFPSLIKSFTVMSCKGVDLPLQIVGLMGTEELLQKFRLQLSPVPNGPWP